jgi:hypothetical protein
LSSSKEVKLAFEMGCAMARSSMRKHSSAFGNIGSDVALSALGLSLGDMAGEALKEEYYNLGDEVTDVLPYLGAASGGYLANLASKNIIKGDKRIPRQGGFSTAAQIASYLGAKGLGADPLASVLASYGGGIAGHLGENAKLK